MLSSFISIVLKHVKRKQESRPVKDHPKVLVVGQGRAPGVSYEWISVSQFHDHTPLGISRLIEKVADMQNSRAQCVNASEALSRKRVIKDEDESKVTLKIHAVYVDGLILIWEKRLELEDNISSIIVDVEDLDTGHINNSERIGFDESVKARRVVQWLRLWDSRPASLCVHVK